MKLHISQRRVIYYHRASISRDRGEAILFISHNVERSRDFISRLLRRKHSPFIRVSRLFSLGDRAGVGKSDSRNRTRSVAIVGSITISRHEARLLARRGERHERNAPRCTGPEWLDRRHVCSLDGDAPGENCVNAM